MALIETGLDSGRRCIISGPVPTLCHGNMKFSQIKQLHTYERILLLLGPPLFLDNFDAFLGRPDLFSRDELHLSRPGSHLLGYLCICN